MQVLAITLLISILLGGIFITCFAVEAWKKRKTSIEHDSLLPLEDDA